MGKSFYRLLHVAIGLEPDHLAILQIGAPQSSYPKDPQVIAMAREVVARVSALPGVKTVGLTEGLPIGFGDTTIQFRVVGRPYRGQHDEVVVRGVNAEYFPALRTELVSGRYFAESEDETKPHVVVINETFARKYFSGVNPIGKELIYNWDSPQPHMLIVGVMKDIKEGQVDSVPRAAMYVPFYQRPEGWFSLVVRTTGPERSLLLEMTEAVHRIDPNIATYNAETMNDRIHDSPSSYLHRSSAWIVGGFAAIALVLSVVGLYGVIAYSVSQRTREIGVRMALGAQRGSVYRLVLGEAGWLAVVGIVAGLGLSIGAAVLMRKLLFGVQAWDVPTLIGVAAVLGAAALFASYIPARRAAAVNPVEALRAE
jgi:predicted permease